MKSVVLKNFVVYALIVAVAFLTLGGIFAFRISVYNRDLLESELDTIAQRASSICEVYYSLLKLTGAGTKGAQVNETYDSGLKNDLRALVKNSGATIILCDVYGNVRLVVNENGVAEIENVSLRRDVLSKIESGGYRGRDRWAGMFPNTSLIYGRQVYALMQYSGIVITAVPVAGLTAFSAELLTSFTAMVILIFVACLVATLIISRRMSKPLTDLTRTVSEFAHGDYSKRISLPRSHDEIYDLTCAFNNMAESIEKNENNRRNLVASVSHDLRTPMTTISGFVDGILDGTIRPEQQEYYLKIISEEIKRLSRLANDMVQVSRFEQESVELKKTAFDITEVVRRVIISFQQRLEEKRIDLSVDMPDVLSIVADSDGMFQAVYNLFDNATKFVSDGGTVKVSVAAKGGKLSFSISNDGPEISPDDIDHIFDQFYKADKSRTGNGKPGTGLGLYIVKTVINRHGGSVAASSAEGITEFTFTIPQN